MISTDVDEPSTEAATTTAAEEIQITHLDPSELGTKEYWDAYYAEDLENEDDDEDEESTSGGDDDYDHRSRAHNGTLDPSSLSSWFDDVNAPAKILAFLTDPAFPLAPAHHHTLSQTPKTPRPHDPPPPLPSVLDLGTGNGSMLFQLRLEGGYTGPMVGVDYSTQSIELARRLGARGRQQHRSGGKRAGDVEIEEDEGGQGGDEDDEDEDERESNTTADAGAGASAPLGTGDIRFEVMDLIQDDPGMQAWWPKSIPPSSSLSSSSPSLTSSPSTSTPPSAQQDQQQERKTPTPPSGFDLVLDKGTFDAISLSSDTITIPFPPKTNNLSPSLPPTSSTTTTTTSPPPPPPQKVRICEIYPRKISCMVKRGGFLVVTSCNWTEEEVVRWFTGGFKAPPPSPPPPPHPTTTTTTTKTTANNTSVPGGADITSKLGSAGDGAEKEAKKEQQQQQRDEEQSKIEEECILEVWGRVKYPRYKFGGQEGQGVATVCFRRVG